MTGLNYAASSLTQFINHNDLANALTHVANSIVLMLAAELDTVLVCEAPIANTALKVLITIDIGMGSMTKDQVKRLVGSDWITFFQGLISSANAVESSIAYGIYLLKQFGEGGMDLQVAVAIGPSQT
jgi:hypothetical protein